VVDQHGPGLAGADPLDGATWRKATASDANSGCVEVALLSGGRVGIRDSKSPGGPAIAVTDLAWASFLADAKTGKFNL
jgi:hypothetical protein